MLRHANHTEMPAAVAGHEQHDTAGFFGGSIHHHLSEPADPDPLSFGRNGGQSEGQGKHEPHERHMSHLVTSSFRPPEIRIETSYSARGSCRPPGEAMYRGSQTGPNLFL